MRRKSNPRDSPSSSWKSRNCDLIWNIQIVLLSSAHQYPSNYKERRLMVYLTQYSYYPLFRCLSIENIVTLFELLVTEYKIIFVSEHASMLSLVCESICSLLYPFYWHHVFIPVLPIRLLSYLQAPVPFVVGITKDSFPMWKQEHWKPSDAAVVDIDNDDVDFPPLKVKLPSRERRKLLAHLERYSGQSHHAIKRGVPESMKYCFPNGRLQLSSTKSAINTRRIQDIPTSMYSTYSNAFLAEKANGGKKFTSKPSSLVTHSSDVRSSTSSTNFSTTSMSAVSGPSFRTASNPSPRSVLKISDSLAAVDESLIRESLGSFGPTPRHSIPAQRFADNLTNDLNIMPESDINVSDNLMLEMHQALIDGTHHDDQTGPSTLFKSPKNPNWWQKMTSSATTSTPKFNTEIKNSGQNKSLSFFDKLLGVHVSQSVSIIPSSQLAINTSLNESPEMESPPAISITNDPMGQSPNLATIKEGHVFHELCLTDKSEEANIELDEEPADGEDEFADRFTPDSNSSDDVSRSDISIATAGTQMFTTKSQRVAGQSRTTGKGAIKKKPVDSPTMLRTEKVKCVDTHQCWLCNEELNARKHSILMCQCTLLNPNCRLPYPNPCQLYILDRSGSMRCTF
jgi:hypothetical protein